MTTTTQPESSTMTTTATPNTITIDGTQFVRADTVNFGPSEWRIVIAQRGWVFVGRYEQDGDDVTLHQASVIRIWGTTKGLGELAINGKTAKTVCDPAGTVRMHALGVVATLDTTHTSW